MIDHLVLATPHVADTAAALAGSWGFPLTPGGSHVGLGTRNELTGLGGDSYLEVVGPDDGQQKPPGPRPFGVDLLSAAQLVTWCARPAAPIDEVVAALRNLGVEPGNPAAMSRQRPDGVLLAWRLTTPLLDPPHGGALPFLIDWQASPHPAASLPHHASLESLRLTHPRPGLVADVLAAIGDGTTDSRIEVVAGQAALSATIRTPNGLVTL